MIQTQILKLEPPYTILICGEDVGRHIATLIVTEEKRGKDRSYGIETHSHAIVTYRPMKDDEYWSASEGVVWDKVELYQCHVVGKDGKESIPFSRLLYFARAFSSWRTEEDLDTFISRYRFMIDTIRNRIKRYGISIDNPPKDGKIGIKLDVVPVSNLPGKAVVCNIWNEGFTFKALIQPKMEDTAQEILQQVYMYKHRILSCDYIPFVFHCENPNLNSLCDYLNKQQGISE